MNDISERARIRTAFRELRKQGINARMNFACCSGCGHYELGQLAKPYVFWNQQSDESSLTIREGTRVRTDYLVRDLYLHFSDVDTGKKVVAALKRQSLPVKWNETDEQAICIESATQPSTTTSQGKETPM